MSLELKAGVDLSGARKVTLAGKDYEIVPFTLRRTIAMAKVAPALEHLSKAKDATLSDEELMAFVDVVRIGLSGAYPSVTNDDVLDLPLELKDLVAAANVVIEQAGGKRAGATAGESSAASGSVISTGISSSPNS